MKHDLAKERPSAELLARLIDEHGVEAVMNPRSPAFKERGLGERKVSKKEAIELMLEDANLIRRPLLLKGKQVVLGYKPEEYDAL